MVVKYCKLSKFIILEIINVLNEHNFWIADTNSYFFFKNYNTKTIYLRRYQYFPTMFLQ